MPAPEDLLKFLIQFFNSGAFVALQIGGGILSVALFVASFWLIKDTGYPQRHVRHLLAAWNAGRVPTHKFARRWSSIENALKKNQPRAWRSAIIDADKMLDGVLFKMGYLGSNLDERLETIKPSGPEQFRSMLEAWRAHQVREFITEDKNYAPTREVAEKTIEIYRNIFTETGILSG